MLMDELTTEQSAVIAVQKTENCSCIFGIRAIHSPISRRHSRWSLATEGQNKSWKVIIGEVISDGIC